MSDATCPTCGSNDPKVLGLLNRTYGTSWNGAWAEADNCRDPFHDTTPEPTEWEEALEQYASFIEAVGRGFYTDGDRLTYIAYAQVATTTLRTTIERLTAERDAALAVCEVGVCPKCKRKEHDPMRPFGRRYARQKDSRVMCDHRYHALRANMKEVGK